MTNLPEHLGFETSYFDLPTLRIHAVVAGPKDGPLVLLLHGFPEFWYGWKHQIKPLARAGFRVVVPDQRGYNLTDKTPPFDIHTLAGDMVQLIEACGHKAAFVAGHDWGGVVAWTLAGLYPHSLKKLAILNVPHPAAMSHELLSGNLKQFLKSWYVYFFQLPKFSEFVLKSRNFAALRFMMKTSSRPDTFSPLDLDRYQEAWSQRGALSAMLGWYRTIVSQTLHKTTPQLGTITTPTLILWGEKDIALSSELAQKSLEHTFQGRLLRFPEATHWVQHDEADSVTRALLEHFRCQRETVL